MEDVITFFRETQATFTIYVVEQRFAVGRGMDYFKSFQGKINYIETNSAIRKQINRILIWVQKHVPSLSDLISTILNLGPSYSIVDTITILNKLFSAHFHQAVGPEVVDPIIIKEDRINTKYINQIVALHEKSILRPAIIIILKDNDFVRARKLLSHCPNGINIKFIRNNGECEIHKVVNSGVDNTMDFMNAYAEQCFSTCSNTPRRILLNDDWSKNNLLNKYMNELLRIRSSLILDEKDAVRKDILNISNALRIEQPRNPSDETLLQCLLCTACLMQVYCNDAGNQDIYTALQLAQSSGNPLLLAQVYRYAYFLNDLSENRQIELLSEGGKIFSQYGMEDQALYCKNNRLIYQFEQNQLHIHEFRSLQEEAINNTPGLVGISYILNNTGVAYLLDGNPDEAIVFFNKGLEYAQKQDRTISRFAIQSNLLIAHACCYEPILDVELKRNLSQMLTSPASKQFAFIFARLALNIITIAFCQNPDLGKELMYNFPIKSLVATAFSQNRIGSGMLLLQLRFLKAKFPAQNFFEGLRIPDNLIDVHGIHRDFILQNGYNPFAFCTWL